MMNDFDKWYDENLRDLLKGNLRDGLMAAWEAAQQAERERTTAIMLKYVRDDNYAQWNEAVKAAVREINEPT
jgi:hypothetical protein